MSCELLPGSFQESRSPSRLLTGRLWTVDVRNMQMCVPQCFCCSCTSGCLVEQLYHLSFKQNKTNYVTRRWGRTKLPSHCVLWHYYNSVFRSLLRKLPTALQKTKLLWPGAPTPLHSPQRPKTQASTSTTWWTSVTTPLSCQWRSLWAPPCSSSTFWLLLLFTTKRTSAAMTSTGTVALKGTLLMTSPTPKRKRSCLYRWSSTLTLTGIAGG